MEQGQLEVWQSSMFEQRSGEKCRPHGSVQSSKQTKRKLGNGLPLWMLQKCNSTHTHTHSLDQQIFKFKVKNGHKEPQETSNSDKLSNIESWGVNVDFKSYEHKWTIDGILQKMCFYPTTENPCLMMRENFKTKCCEYIVVYQDDLYIASPTPEDILNILQNMYKININPEFYQGSK